MNSELEKVADWCNANVLSLNVKKSQFIWCFAALGKILCLDDLSISIAGTPLTRVASSKFLGVIIDLYFISHINHIVKKISRNIGLISRMLHYFKNSYHIVLLPYISTSKLL